MAGFQVGQRVMVVDYPTTASQEVTGYYGHVVNIYPHFDIPERTMVDVDLKGRVGGEARAGWLASNGATPWIFFEHELEAAD